MHSGFSFRWLILAIALCAIGLAPAVAGASDDGASAVPWQEMVSQVSESQIYDSTYALQNFTTRDYPSPGNSQAAEYLYDRLSGIPGLEVRYQNETYRNVIASLPGRGSASGEVVVVGAHYDSSSSDPALAPGAYDNGCGVAVVLELARVMSQHEFNRTIQFALWNRGEDGMLGSADYVAAALGESLVIPLYLNFDCPGYDPDNRYELDIIHNANAAPIAGAAAGYNAAYGIDFNLTFNEYTCVSDHRPFWRAGYPGIWFHAHPHNPDENSPNDTIEHLSFSNARKNAELGLVILAETAGRAGPGMAPVPGATGVPQDTDGDGLYDDVNGNERRDFADVVLYFNQMNWIAANEPVAAFDYNGNGRIDFADVVWLFNSL